MTRLSVRVTLAAALAVFVAVAVLGVATRLIVSHELERSLAPPCAPGPPTWRG